MSYGKTLKEARQAVGLTQEQLADQITQLGHSVTGGNVSNIEREADKDKDGNPIRPNKKFVIFAARVLGQDIDQHLMLADYAPNNRNLLPVEFQDFNFSEFSRTLLNEIAEFIRFKLFTQNQGRAEATRVESESVGITHDRDWIEEDRAPVTEDKKVTNGKHTDL